MTQPKPFTLPRFRVNSYSLGLFSNFNAQRCTNYFHPIEDWSEREWALACAGTVGTLCNLLKQRWRGDLVFPERLWDEIADAVTYLDLLCTRLGAPLSQVLAHKFNRVSAAKHAPYLLPLYKKDD